MSTVIEQNSWTLNNIEPFNHAIQSMMVNEHSIFSRCATQMVHFQRLISLKPRRKQKLKIDSLDEIKRLASEQGATAKRGSRLRFIQKVWGRLEELAGCN